MKSKALKSLDAATILVNTRKTSGFNSSIHCSYYAVFQYMKYMLAKTTKQPLSYEAQDAKVGDSHENILVETTNRIGNPQKGRAFAEMVRWLKKKRKAADYSIRDFEEVESLECKERAISIISKLKQYFGDL